MKPVVREFCPLHMYGSFIDGPFGLECIACLKKAGDLPEDYELCAECGHDHEYEPGESQAIHSRLDRS